MAGREEGAATKEGATGVATSLEGAVEDATIRAEAIRATTISSKEGATRAGVATVAEEGKEGTTRGRAAADSTTTTSTTRGAAVVVEAVAEEGGTKAIGAVSVHACTGSCDVPMQAPVALHAWGAVTCGNSKQWLSLAHGRWRSSCCSGQTPECHACL